MKKVLITAGLAFISTVHSPSVASAEPSVADPRITETLQLFSSFCIRTGGLRDRAIAILGNGNAIATRLPDDVVRSAQRGLSGGVGWAIRTPRDAVLMLDYNNIGICSVRVLEAEPMAMISAFRTLIMGMSRAAHSEPKVEGESQNVIDGIKTEYFAYSLPAGENRMQVALTSAEKPLNGQQHLLTFGFVK